MFIVFGISDTADGLSLQLLDFGPVDHDLDQWLLGHWIDHPRDLDPTLQLGGATPSQCRQQQGVGVPACAASKTQLLPPVWGQSAQGNSFAAAPRPVTHQTLPPEFNHRLGVVNLLVEQALPLLSQLWCHRLYDAVQQFQLPRLQGETQCGDALLEGCWAAGI